MSKTIKFCPVASTLPTPKETLAQRGCQKNPHPLTGNVPCDEGTICDSCVNQPKGMFKNE